MKSQDETPSKRHIADEVDPQEGLGDSGSRQDALDLHQESVLVPITSKYRIPSFWLAKLNNSDGRRFKGYHVVNLIIHFTAY